MANTDKPNGFRPAYGEVYHSPHKWTVAGSEAIAVGDVVYLNSDGRVAFAAAGQNGDLLGVAATAVTTAATTATEIWVWDHPLQVFEGQYSGNGALTDPFTTRSSAACFALAGTTGIQEINESSSTGDCFKIVGVGRDPANGEVSAVGANQRVKCRLNLAKHVFGTTA